jgi:hypothetical protein
MSKAQRRMQLSQPPIAKQCTYSYSTAKMPYLSIQQHMYIPILGSNQAQFLNPFIFVQFSSFAQPNQMLALVLYFKK